MERNQLRHEIERLQSDRQPFAAIDVMSQHAAARDAVWWGCCCAWSLWRPAPPTAEEPSLEIASQWVMTGDDQFRKSAVALEETLTGHGRWLIKGVINSGGTLAREGLPVEQPTPNLTGRFIAAYLQFLMADQPPVERPRIAQQFTSVAKQILSGPLPEPVQTRPAALASS